MTDEMDAQSYKDNSTNQSKEEPDISIIGNGIRIKDPSIGTCLLIKGPVDSCDYKDGIFYFEGTVEGIYPNGIIKESLVDGPIENGEINLRKLLSD